MNVKSPCIDKCNLNEANNRCTGCHRTVEEITEWNSYNNFKKKEILKLLKLRKFGFLSFVFLFLLWSNVYSSVKWTGKWVALDQWQSEFNIVIKQDGTSITDYGSGDEGNWSIVDGNLMIKWSSGKEDYIFSGVMGYQRLSKDKNGSYTSGLRKLLD